MGSFNLSCAITKAPIKEKQKVRLFFITDTGGYKGDGLNGCLVYPESGYEVIGFPIKAKYSDYGTYEIDDESDVAEMTLKIIKTNYAENIVEEGKTIDDYNLTHDHMNIAVDNLDWYTVQDMIHSGRLFLNNRTKKSHVAIMAVHEKVYQKMIEGDIKSIAKEISHVSAEALQKSKDDLIKLNSIINDTFVIGHIFTERVEVEVTEENKERIFSICEKEREECAKTYNFSEETLTASKKELIEEVSVGLFVSIKEEIICTEENLVLCKEKGLKSIMSLYIDPVLSNIEEQIGSNRQHYSLHLVEEDLKSTNYGKLFAESACINEWMQCMNMIYAPTKTSGQYCSYKEHAKTLHELADIVLKLR
jgi:hypothetical protein